jgi:hypothetical protein
MSGGRATRDTYYVELSRVTSGKARNLVLPKLKAEAEAVVNVRTAKARNLVATTISNLSAKTIGATVEKAEVVQVMQGRVIVIATMSPSKELCLLTDRHTTTIMEGNKVVDIADNTALVQNALINLLG